MKIKQIATANNKLGDMVMSYCNLSFDSSGCVRQQSVSTAFDRSSSPAHIINIPLPLQPIQEKSEHTETPVNKAMPGKFADSFGLPRARVHSPGQKHSRAKLNLTASGITHPQSGTVNRGYGVGGQANTGRFVF